MSIESICDWFSAVGYEWFPAMADVAVKGMAILLLTWLATLAMWRASASARHLVWFLGTLCVMVLPILSATLPGWYILPKWTISSTPSPQPQPAPTVFPIPQPETSQLAPEENHQKLDTNVIPLYVPPQPHSAFTPPALVPPSPAKNIAIPAQSPFNLHLGWQGWALLAWSLGASIYLGYMLAACLSLWRIRRRSSVVTDPTWLALLEESKTTLQFHRPVELLASPQRAMPMTWGLTRTRILVPGDCSHWTVAQRRAVLLHELAHAKRLDCQTQLIAHLACACHWFNPLVWFVWRQMQAEREQACDDLVLSSGTKASAYAEQLLQIATEMPSIKFSAAAIAMARPSKLEGRLLAILDVKRNRRALSWTAAIIAMLLMTALATPLAMLRAQDGSISDKTADSSTKPSTQVAVSSSKKSAVRKGRPMTAVATVQEWIAATTAHDAERTGAVVMSASAFARNADRIATLTAQIKTFPGRSEGSGAAEVRTNEVTFANGLHSNLTFKLVGDTDHWQISDVVDERGYSLMADDAQPAASGQTKPVFDRCGTPPLNNFVRFASGGKPARPDASFAIINSDALDDSWILPRKLGLSDHASIDDVVGKTPRGDLYEPTLGVIVPIRGSRMAPLDLPTDTTVVEPIAFQRGVAAMTCEQIARKVRDYGKLHPDTTQFTVKAGEHYAVLRPDGGVSVIDVAGSGVGEYLTVYPIGKVAMSATSGSASSTQPVASVVQEPGKTIVLFVHNNLVYMRMGDKVMKAPRINVQLLGGDQYVAEKYDWLGRIICHRRGTTGGIMGDRIEIPPNGEVGAWGGPAIWLKTAADIKFMDSPTTRPASQPATLPTTESVSATQASPLPAATVAAEPKTDRFAADLVRNVREEENWLTRVNSFRIRLADRWTSLKDGHEQPSVDRTTTDLGFDARRMYVRYEAPQDDMTIHQKSWDGEEVVGYYQYLQPRKLGTINDNPIVGTEMYSLISRDVANDMEPSFLGYLPRVTTSRYQFWWVAPDRRLGDEYYGRPEDYRVTNKEIFHDVDCYVLDSDSQGGTLYVGVADHHLHGLIQRAIPGESNPQVGPIEVQVARDFGGDVKDGPQYDAWYYSLPAERKHQAAMDYSKRVRPLERTMAVRGFQDYKQVAPAKWLPMRQVVENWNCTPNETSAQGRRDSQVVDVAIDQPLPEQWFPQALKEGVVVTDSIHNPPLTYVYKQHLTAAEWSAILEDGAKRETRAATESTIQPTTQPMPHASVSSPTEKLSDANKATQAATEDKSGTVFVMGAVTRSGAYSIAEKSLTLQQLVISAGVNSMQRTVALHRHDGRDYDEFNLADIASGRVADPPLEAGDVAIVTDRVNTTTAPTGRGTAIAPATNPASEIYVSGAAATSTTQPVAGLKVDHVSDVVGDVVNTISTCAEGDPRIAGALAKLKGFDEAMVVKETAGFLVSTEDNTRRAAIYVLWRGEFKSIGPAIEPLIEACKHKEDLTRGMAALALGGNHAGAGKATLIEMATADKSPYARRCAAYALGLLGDPSALPTLQTLVTDADPQVGNNAKAAIKMLNAAAMPATSQPTTQPAAVGLNADQQLVLQWTDDQFRQFFDARTFDGWSDAEKSKLESRCIDALKGPMDQEYYQSIGTLAALKSTKGLSALREIAFDRHDKNNRDRWMAIRALGLMGDRESVPQLIHLVYHGNTNTHWWAQISLVRLTGQNFGSDWQAWGKWWNAGGNRPTFDPTMIRWWAGQPEPEQLAKTLAAQDEKFLEPLRARRDGK